MQIIVPDYVPYLLAVLGLLFVWQLHHMQVVAGRIEAKNFWDQSGIRLFINITPDDEQTCPECKEANGVAVIPAIAAKKNFAPLCQQDCTNPGGCRCQLIGLHCSWPQGQRLLSYVTSSAAKRVRVSGEKLDTLLNVDWDQHPKSKSDLVAVSMLQAIRAEGKDEAAAVRKYRQVVDEARHARDLPLVLPAYLRMLDLLERSQRTTEALALIERFEKQFNSSGAKAKGPTQAQREMLSLRKTRLTAVAQRPA